MMTAWFFSGASLFALLIVDICCLPVKQGFNPSASHGGGGYSHAAPYFGSSQEAPSSQFAPGAAMSYSAPSKGVSKPAYQPVPQREPSYTQSGVYSEPAASFGSSSSPGPALPGYRGSSVRKTPTSPKQPGAAFQPGSQDINWVVAPPGIFSAGEDVSPGSRGVGSSGPVNVSPPLPPPGPEYQAGELSHYEQTIENGDYQTETEEQGFLPPPPMQVSAEQGFTSSPQPESSMGGSWGTYPYYDYDFMFLTGQYPPGTVSHYSSSNEQGRDNWQNVHYMRYYAPYNPGPAQQTEAVAVPQSFTGPSPPVMAGYGQGGAAAGVSSPSRGSFMQPGRYEEPALPQAGGYNLGKGRGY